MMAQRVKTQDTAFKRKAYGLSYALLLVVLCGLWAFSDSNGESMKRLEPAPDFDPNATITVSVQ
jgi:hypothetical protein